MINNFNGKELYDWLSLNEASTNLIDCGSSGLCFKKAISVGITQSICFLKFDNKIEGNMRIDILCRTQGKDLYEFMFRDGSNIAVSIFGNIAIEAAGLAYIEIRTASINLRRDSLWNSFLTFQVGSEGLLGEMLQLCDVKPFDSLLGNGAESNRLLALFNDPALIDPIRFCDSLAKDPAFSLSWQSDDTANQQLFYIHNDGYYLMVSTFVNGKQFHLELITGANKYVYNSGINRVVQKVVNFMIYFVWSETGDR
jgi:hypothetical protein